MYAVLSDEHKKKKKKRKEKREEERRNEFSPNDYLTHMHTEVEWLGVIELKLILN